MKLLPVLIIAWCALIAHSTDPPKSSEDGNLLERASAQLDRLAPFRGPADSRSDGPPAKQESPNAMSPQDILEREMLLVQIYQQVPEDLREEVMKGIGRKNSEFLQTLTDPVYLKRMEERIKRSGVEYSGYGHDSYGSHEYGGGGYGHGHSDSGSGSGGIISGSGSIISGIASGILGGIASAAAGASKGSFSGSAQASAGSSGSSSGSNYKDTPSYGHSYSYDDKQHFDVWDFKKAIVNTLVQAIKAISGGVIALKGQLIKGSGFLVSTKGRIISSTGEAISSLGRHIAKSAVVTNSPKHPEYSYGPPDHHDHDHTPYEGPAPPSQEDYGHDDYNGNSHYGAPSDDGDDHAGLLLVKPTQPDFNHHHETPAADLDPRKPEVSHIESDYDGPPPVESHKEHHEEHHHQEHSGVEHHEEIQHHHAEAYHSHQPATTYGVPNHHTEPYHLSQPPITHDVSNHHTDSYHANQPSLPHGHSSHHGPQPPTSYDVPLNYASNEKDTHYPLYPPFPQDPFNLGNNHLTVQQSMEYPPIHIQQIEYGLPNKNALLASANSIKPEKDLSVYSSLSIGFSPELTALKYAPHAPHANSYELPGVQAPANFHGSSGHGPLKIPLLNPPPANFWYGQGFMQPATGFALHRRRSGSSQKRRRLAEDSAWYSMSPARHTRAHRL